MKNTEVWGFILLNIIFTLNQALIYPFLSKEMSLMQMWGVDTFVH